MSIAGLMSTPRYSKNIIRTGDIGTNAPFTVLNSEMGTVIQLPLPVNLSSNMGADWQQEQVGIIRYQSMHNKKLTRDLIDSSSSFKDMMGVLDQKGADLINQGSEDIKTMHARLKNSKSQLGGAKIAMNPRNEMLFNGMQFKSYSFNFVLVPYRQKDSDDIQKAIREIQKASAPELRGEKMFMEYPDTWKIKFMSGGGGSGNEYLMKINECCCTNVGVNYTPQNDSTNMHENNAPLAVELTLDFTEIIIPTKDIMDQYNG